MNLVKWTGNNDIFDIFNHFDCYFDNVVSDNYTYKKQNFLINEDEKYYFLSMDMPGANKKDIQITIDDSIVNINAVRDRKKNQSLDSKRFNYSQSFNIPDDVQDDKITAKFTNGVLDIQIPKLKQVKKDIKKIEIS